MKHSLCRARKEGRKGSGTIFVWWCGKIRITNEDGWRARKSGSSRSKENLKRGMYSIREENGFLSLTVVTYLLG